MQQQSLHLSWYWYRQQSEETWLRSWEATQEGGERLYPRKPKVYRSNSKFLMHVHPKTYHPLIRSFALLYFLWVIVTAVELTLWERTCYQSLLLGWKLQELLQSASRKTSEDSWQATYIRNKGSHRSCNVIPNHVMVMILKMNQRNILQKSTTFYIPWHSFALYILGRAILDFQWFSKD